MKKILYYSLLPLIIIATTLFTSCSKDLHIDSIKFKKADITGAMMLALGQDAQDAKDANVVSMLYKVNEDGILEEVEYTIEVRTDNDSAARVVNARVRLSIREMIPFGEKWLWLKECRFVCPTLDEIEDDEIRKEVLELLERENFTRHYLVRLSDGALFEWSVGIPYGGFDFTPNTPQHFRGHCETYGEDLISVENTNIMYRLKDMGNNIEVSTVTPTNIGAFNVLPLKDGVHIGGELNYGGGREPFIINPNTVQIIPITVSSDVIAGEWDYTYTSNMVCIDGELYIPFVAYKQIPWEDDLRRLSFCKVNFSGNTAAANEEVAAVDVPADAALTITGMENTGLAEPLIYGKIFSFISGDTWSNYSIFTFDPEHQTLTYKDLPDHYPNDATKYREGVGYVVDHTSSIPSAFWRCDLSKEAAESIPIIWDGELQNYSSQMVTSSLVLEYDMSSNQLLGYCMLLDGRKVSFHADVEGPEQGRMHLLLEGEQTAGIVVTTMVRLN